MSKKLYICKGKACKKTKSHKHIKDWGTDLIKDGKLKKIKKTDCLGICKKGFAVEFKGEVHSCPNKEELEKVVTKKK